MVCVIILVHTIRGVDVLIRKNAQINSDTLMKDGGTPSSGGRRKEKKKIKKKPSLHHKS
jgi:hypothetical protein